jgi:hypothetical protein
MSYVPMKKNGVYWSFETTTTLLKHVLITPVWWTILAQSQATILCLYGAGACNHNKNRTVMLQKFNQLRVYSEKNGTYSLERMINVFCFSDEEATHFFVPEQKWKIIQHSLTNHKED